MSIEFFIRYFQYTFKYWLVKMSKIYKNHRKLENDSIENLFVVQTGQFFLSWERVQIKLLINDGMNINYYKNMQIKLLFQHNHSSLSFIIENVMCIMEMFASVPQFFTLIQNQFRLFFRIRNVKKNVKTEKCQLA